MINLDDKLENIVHILSDLEVFFNSSGLYQQENQLQEHFRRLNFEANEFFEKLTPKFDISNPLPLNIVRKISKILNMPGMNNRLNFEYKTSILNLQIYMAIHLLFSLSSNSLQYQIEKQKYLELLVENIFLFEEVPLFTRVVNLEEKLILDNHLRIFGSMGDLYYLLCSNLSVIDEKFLVKWSNKCFKFFYLLDQTIEKFNPLDFYSQNNLPVEDLYREIVGHYTILGNTNATNLLEFLLSLDRKDLFAQIQFKPYINSATISDLEKKIHGKAEKISILLKGVEESKNNDSYFSQEDDPLNVISFRLMSTLENYFQYNQAKISSYKKEFNQLQTPTSQELHNTLELCELWLEKTISLTEENENILDTPFGGLFNSVFLEYLLLLALEDGKKIIENQTKKPVLEIKLEKYNHIYLSNNYSLEQIADFIYIKTYSQIYVYLLLNSIETIKELMEEFYAFLTYLDKKPFLKLNSLFLVLVLEILINKKDFSSLQNITNSITKIVQPHLGLEHIQEDVQSYLSIIRNFSEGKPFSFDSLSIRLKPKVLDINSWLIPNLENLLISEEQRKFKFVSFNQMVDRIITTH